MLPGLRVTVKVGNIFHPMDQEHSIGWVCLVTKAGCIMRVPLTPDCEPVASFTLEEGGCSCCGLRLLQSPWAVEKISLILPAFVSRAKCRKHPDKNESRPSPTEGSSQSRSKTVTLLVYLASPYQTKTCKALLCASYMDTIPPLP